MPTRKLAISFGLVHIPVELNPVIKNNDIAFNMLHKKTGERIKLQRVNSANLELVDNKDIVKGYEYENGKYVIFTNEDIAKLQIPSDNNIEIISFVNLLDIDPIYYEKSYYLTTRDNSKAFALLKKVLEKQGKVAIAKVVLGYKSYYVTLRFGKNNILMNTLYFEEEINLEDNHLEAKFTKAELDMATKLIDAMSDKFRPNDYKDDYQTRIRDAIEKKIEGKEIVKPKGRKIKTIDDLMTALKKSVEQAK